MGVELEFSVHTDLREIKSMKVIPNQVMTLSNSKRYSGFLFATKGKLKRKKCHLPSSHPYQFYYTAEFVLPGSI